MYKRYGNKMMCFSPPVMLMTFIVEFSLALYTLFRYKLNPVTRLAVLILTFLGTFQLTEYMICGGLGMGHVEWAKLGYVSITILPPLAIHLSLAIAKHKFWPLLVTAYGTAAAYIVYFVVNVDSVIHQECATNYAVFSMHGTPGMLYGLYYYGWLLVGVGTTMLLARRYTKVAPALRWLAVGYVSFILPTTFVNLIDASTIRAIPSIMCGFAIIFALIIAWRIIPLYNAAQGGKISKSRPKKS